MSESSGDREKHLTITRRYTNTALVTQAKRKANRLAFLPLLRCLPLDEMNFRPTKNKLFLERRLNANHQPFHV